ncbi:GGDEF domain-containing protein [Actinoplanes flavus]|uniref:GGDEF domain-containing protein n=1 Tax=Actinoplanes flavus TaxID=2820290 RepID=A0ABS3UV95_9ACTN|nr:GGDEF domain-containing protein [Actinoplanes flavus]MBO3742467.1 GGDEF domain-containing protein [Actinoplanes flavus]
MRYRTPPVAMASYVLSGICLLVHLTGLGGWMFQLHVYRMTAPLVLLGPIWMAWRAARQAVGAGARQFARYSGAAWTTMALGATVGMIQLVITGNTTYPSANPVLQLSDLVALVLILIALVAVPVNQRWAGSVGRFGLDMAIVLVTGLLFSWYFFVEPTFDRGAGTMVAAFVLLRTGGVLVAIFAVARLVLGGTSEMSRRTLLTWGGSGICLVALGVSQRNLPPAQMHLALAAWALFTGLITAVAAAHLRSVETAAARPAPAAPATEPTSARRSTSTMPYLAAVASYALLTGVLLNGRDHRSWPIVAGSIVLTCLVVIRQFVSLRDNGRLLAQVEGSLFALREALRREQILKELGTVLLTTTDAAEVHRLTVAAAANVVAKCPGARTAVVRVTPDDPDNWTVLRAAGSSTTVVAGVRVPGHNVPDELLARLADGEVISGPSLAALGVRGMEAVGARPTILFPLLNGARFFGVLTVGADHDLPADVLESLQTLRTQVSLALDSVALTDELTRRAMHDMLTGLGNRALLWDRLTVSLARTRRTNRTVGVLLLDLNGFKPVNDTYGHDAGDLVLIEVADRLRDCVRAEDTVVRLGGDEFVILAEDLTDAEGALIVADRVVRALNEPIVVEGRTVHTPASLGIALARPGDKPDDVLRDADTAMYVAKHRGGAGSYHLFGDSADAERVDECA